ncbi:UNVERIFIED_CONTAM: IclR family KDG regulon transcriptional repressor [Brevibacillus sp. OAP136]
MKSEVGTLKKGLDVLALILERPNMSIQEIIDTLQINRSTTYRLISTLEQQQFIARNENNRYEAAEALTQKLLKGKGGASLEMDWIAVPQLLALSKKTDETVFCGVISGTEMVTTHVIDGNYAARTHAKIGDRHSLHHDAIGKCILAFQSPEKQQWVLDHIELVQKTENTIVTRDAFTAELQRIRENGFAEDNEEGEVGLRCIAAPIRKNGDVIAAIAISGPSLRVSKEKDPLHSQLVRECAASISNQLS